MSRGAPVDRPPAAGGVQAAVSGGSGGSGGSVGSGVLLRPVSWSAGTATRSQEPPEPREPTEPRNPTTFEIISPLGGATFLRDPTLRPEFQTLALRAHGANGRIEWRVNGVVVGSAPADDPLRWALIAGQHDIEARDAGGRTSRTRITVK